MQLLDEGHLLWSDCKSANCTNVWNHLQMFFLTSDLLQMILVKWSRLEKLQCQSHLTCSQRFQTWSKGRANQSDTEVGKHKKQNQHQREQNTSFKTSQEIQDKIQILAITNQKVCSHYLLWIVGVLEVGLYRVLMPSKSITHSRQQLALYQHVEPASGPETQ